MVISADLFDMSTEVNVGSRPYEISMSVLCFGSSVTSNRISFGAIWHEIGEPFTTTENGGIDSSGLWTWKTTRRSVGFASFQIRRYR